MTSPKNHPGEGVDPFHLLGRAPIHPATACPITDIAGGLSRAASCGLPYSKHQAASLGLSYRYNYCLSPLGRGPRRFSIVAGPPNPLRCCLPRPVSLRTEIATAIDTSHQAPAPTVPLHLPRVFSSAIKSSCFCTFQLPAKHSDTRFPSLLDTLPHTRIHYYYPPSSAPVPAPWSCNPAPRR